MVYRNLCPGIDMVYSREELQLKSEFRIVPGARPSTIHLRYTCQRRRLYSVTSSADLPLLHPAQSALDGWADAFVANSMPTVPRSTVPTSVGAESIRPMLSQSMPVAAHFLPVLLIPWTCRFRDQQRVAASGHKCGPFGSIQATIGVLFHRVAAEPSGGSHGFHLCGMATTCFC